MAVKLPPPPSLRTHIAQGIASGRLRPVAKMRSKALIQPGSASSSDWIKGALKHHGVLKSMATRAGMSTKDYALAHKNDSGSLGDRARLALTLMGLKK